MKFLKTHTGAMVVLAVVIVLSVLLGSHRSLVQAREKVEAQFAPIAGDLQDCLDITANLLTVAGRYLDEGELGELMDSRAALAESGGITEAHAAYERLLGDAETVFLKLEDCALSGRDADYVKGFRTDLAAEQYIIDKNQSLFENTGGEIVVVSVDFMDGMDAADYAMAVAESWGGIGDESLNNGFLLVYAVGENKVWAMAGSGIEDALPASKIEGWLEADFYGGYDAGEYDSATRAFFDDVYGWYESYYGTSAGTVVPSEPGRDFGYYPEPENDFVFAVVGQMGLFLLILLVVVVVCAADGWRYRRYRRRYLLPGMPPPPYVYRPFIFGRPHRPRPPRPPRGPRPPMGGGFRPGGGFRGGGAGRSGGGFSRGGGFRSGGSFRGGGFRGGGAGRR